jgi:hypothetical protein
MKVFYGSDRVIKNGSDFDNERVLRTNYGFFVTASLSQAIQDAQIKAIENKSRPVVNMYDLRIKGKTVNVHEIVEGVVWKEEGFYYNMVWPDFSRTVVVDIDLIMKRYDLVLAHSIKMKTLKSKVFKLLSENREIWNLIGLINDWARYDLKFLGVVKESV